MKTTKGRGVCDADYERIASPVFFKQVAIGIAIAAPMIAFINWKVHDFSMDDSYKCRHVSSEECDSMKRTEAKLRERMRQSTIADATVTPEEEERRRNNSGRTIGLTDLAAGARM